MKKTIAIVGLGYVGLPLALLADSKGYRVYGIDIDPKKVELINRHLSPFKDEQISKKLKVSSLRATSDFSVIEQASIIIICVPTPIYENRLPNYEPVEAACREISPHLQPGQLIVLESTVNPGVSEELLIPILEKFSDLCCGHDFYAAHCPERINPGDPRWQVNNIPRVVGGYDSKSLELALEFYRSIIEAEVRPMGSLKEAEAVKVTENSFRNINIAFVNELAKSFSKLGIDVVNVIEGAATKPFSFMPHYPGCGIGGHCIPVDPYYLIDYAQKNGFDHEFLKLACHVNEEMPKFTVDLLEEELQRQKINRSHAKIALLGLAYKANIDDFRESPSFNIEKELKKRKLHYVTFDPFIPQISTAKNLNEALLGATAVIIATSHRQFISALTPNLIKKNKIKIVIDGRNCLPKSEFVAHHIVYRGIGR